MSRPVSTLSSWVVVPRPAPSAGLRLFCFPYAGAGASVFYSWPRALPAEVEVCAVQFPGREARIAEPAFTDVHALVDVLAGELAPWMDRPFAFFGHSNGALIAFELARRLRRDGRRGPAHIFASGRPAPQVPLWEEPIHALPEPEFLQALRRFKGTPEEILQNAEIMEMVSPTLRADFSISETYEHVPEAPLSVPITVYGGRADEEVPEHTLDPWREQTAAAYQKVMFPGDHFFLNGDRDALLRQLTAELRGVLGALGLARVYA
ncbi:MAG TPA: alpha/beta fold hydrolase [Longimicrobium sp.]|nr:alpha/beta fold hydrolase [Longimicrobium sp.]